MALTIQERLKDLRVERGLTLEQLAEQTHLSKSALGSYEAEDFKDISHYALIKLAKFYGVTADYLLGLSETKNHPNADLADLRLSDDMIELLKSGLVNNSLLCELATHPAFPRFMADLEIYVNGVAVKQVQAANAIVDTMSATIMKRYNPGLTDPQLRQLVAAHIDDDSFCRYVIQQDINGIGLAGLGIIYDVSTQNSDLCHALFSRFDLHRKLIVMCRGSRRFFCQLPIVQQLMFGEKIYSLRHLFQVKNLCPSRIPSAFPSL